MRNIKLRSLGDDRIVEVRVYDAHDSMFRAVRRMSGEFPNVTRDLAAYCEGTPRLLPSAEHLAVVFLCTEYFSHGVIAHELLHAATMGIVKDGVRSLKLEPEMASATEERHAGYMEELINEFWRRL